LSRDSSRTLTIDELFAIERAINGKTPRRNWTFAGSDSG